MSYSTIYLGNTVFLFAAGLLRARKRTERLVVFNLLFKKYGFLYCDRTYRKHVFLFATGLLRARKRTEKFVAFNILFKKYGFLQCDRTCRKYVFLFATGLLRARKRTEKFAVFNFLFRNIFSFTATGLVGNTNSFLRQACYVRESVLKSLPYSIFYIGNMFSFTAAEFARKHKELFY